MNIKFLTFILCAGLLCAQAVKAEDAASVEDFGLDETIATVEDTVAENEEEAKREEMEIEYLKRLIDKD